jgi:hypothetical protein
MFQGLGASERTIDEVFDRAEQDYLGIDQMVHSLQRDISSANNQLIASFSNLQVNFMIRGGRVDSN